jgi:hypothetical protein
MTTPNETLLARLRDALDARMTVPCVAGHGWLSDSRRERSEAALACALCGSSTLSVVWVFTPRSVSARSQ